LCSWWNRSLLTLYLVGIIIYDRYSFLLFLLDEFNISSFVTFSLYFSSILFIVLLNKLIIGIFCLQTIFSQIICRHGLVRITKVANSWFYRSKRKFCLESLDSIRRRFSFFGLYLHVRYSRSLYSSNIFDKFGCRTQIFLSSHSVSIFLRTSTWSIILGWNTRIFRFLARRNLSFGWNTRIFRFLARRNLSFGNLFFI